MGWIFDPEQLRDIARRGMGLPHEAMCRTVIDGLAEAWPGHIEPNPDWLFNITAGATGMMAVVHGSLTEYVLLFGSAVGTEGFSGRYRMDIYDTVISGEMWTYTESDFRRREVHKPGEMALLRRGNTKGFRIAEDTWMLEYARGIIPASLPLALADSVFSAMDGTTIFKTFKVYGRLVTRELMQGKV